MEAFVLLADRAMRELLFSPGRGSQAGPSHLFIFIDGPARKFSFAVSEFSREAFWSQHEKDH